MEIIGEGTRPASPQERELLTRWATEDFNISASQFRLFCNSELNKYNRHLKKRGSDKTHRHESAEFEQIQQLVNLYQSGEIDSLTVKIEPIANNIKLDTVTIKSFKIVNEILQQLGGLPKGKKFTLRAGRQSMAKRDLFVMQLIRSCELLIEYETIKELCYFAALALNYIGLDDTIKHKDTQGIKSNFKDRGYKRIYNVYRNYLNR